MLYNNFYPFVDILYCCVVLARIFYTFINVTVFKDQGLSPAEGFVGALQSCAQRKALPLQSLMYTALYEA